MVMCFWVTFCLCHCQPLSPISGYLNVVLSQSRSNLMLGYVLSLEWLQGLINFGIEFVGLKDLFSRNIADFFGFRLR